MTFSLLEAYNNFEREVNELKKTIKEWKDFHRDIVGLLGLKVIERSVTLAEIKKLVRGQSGRSTNNP